MLGSHLKWHRENILLVDSVRRLSFSSNIDQSKLSKIEKGQVDIRFDTLIEVAITYKLKPSELLDFKIDFWEKETD